MTEDREYRRTQWATGDDVSRGPAPADLQDTIRQAQAAQRQRREGLHAALVTVTEIERAFGGSPYRATQRIETRARRAADAIRALRDEMEGETR